MGSEQSQPASAGAAGRSRPASVLQRGKSVPERAAGPPDGGDMGRAGTVSPGPSICSDSDLPYISYTVNRPIGDSPKLPQKQAGQLQRGKSLGPAPPGSSQQASRRAGGAIPKKLGGATAAAATGAKPAHNIVVVKPALSEVPTERDADLVKLQTVPMFLPIMRGTLNLPAVRDPEVLERLDPNGLLALCVRYQQHLRTCAEAVAADQTQIAHRCKEIDSDVGRLLALMTERQRTYARYAERLGKVHELSHQLNRCHTSLNQTLESMETLNNELPLEERLEPFVWTTG